MINGFMLRDAIISGANNISKNRTAIDELNIFPVPDGDTGTNMAMTNMAAPKELTAKEEPSVGKVASAAASYMLRGARGNSGVILSLLFRGFSNGLKGLEEADGEALVHALELGVEAAYKAVMNPTEGTILTVARVAAETSRAMVGENNEVLPVWEAICNGADAALATTPDLLPVLKKAGVVDAGGKGLTVIFDGMMSVLRDGIIIENDSSSEESTEDAFRNAAAEFDAVINFTYCTEFIVGRNPEVTKEPMELRAYLETIGDCVLVVDDEEIIKVHVHTEDPGNALQAGLTFGQLLTVKIENMKEQHRKAAEENDAKKSDVPQKVEKVALDPVEPTEEVGFVAVAAGEGIRGLFTDLGCTHVVSGGQTMNPSTEDLLEAVRATPAKVVYLLPNNKNIIMAGEQAAEICDDRKIVLLPTKTIPQGLSAMLVFDPDASEEDNVTNMMEAASHVTTGQVTFAARDSEFGGFKIKEGDILGLENGKLTTVEHDIVKCATHLTRSIVDKDTAFLTVIYGEDVTDEQAEELHQWLESKYGSRIEITMIKGEQPVYYFILSAE